MESPLTLAAKTAFRSVRIWLVTTRFIPNCGARQSDSSQALWVNIPKTQEFGSNKAKTAAES